MKEGDKVIWNSGFGYEIGYFINESDENIFNTSKVNLITGIVIGECLRTKREVIPFTPEKLDEMVKLYGYTLNF